MYKKIRKKFTLKIIEERNILILPCLYTEKNVKKVILNLCEYLNNAKIKNVVLTPQLLKNKDILNALKCENINIIAGEKLVENSVVQIVEYCSKKMHIEEKDMEVAFLINEQTKTKIENIVAVVNKIKMVKIVTNKTETFKELETKLLEQYGIMIRISNNRKKALYNSRIIINMDFNNELINKFNICSDAIIFNINNDVNILTKQFERYKCKTDKLLYT